MMPLNIYAGGHAGHLEAFTTKLSALIKKINSDPQLSPLEKFGATQKAIESAKKDKKESLKNCY